MYYETSKSGLFELWQEILIEGDCCTRTQCYLSLVDTYHSAAELHEAYENHCNPYGEFRYPEAYARVMNTLARRNEQREREARAALETPMPW